MRKVKGTLLPKNATKSGAFYYLHSFQYGYVDNLPNSDLNGNSFDIAWAVDEARNKVKLDFIDFVKVYCAELQDAGWLGETSTEVAGGGEGPGCKATSLASTASHQSSGLLPSRRSSP